MTAQPPKGDKMIKRCKTFEGAYKRAEYYIRSAMLNSIHFKIESYPKQIRLIMPFFHLYLYCDPIPDVVSVVDNQLYLDFYFGI